MASLYTASSVTVFTQYNEQFDFLLTSREASLPQTTIMQTNWYLNRCKLTSEIVAAKNAIILASDIGNAQAACDRATYLRENQSLFF